ncbi:hypothetical protein EOL70_11045 [Leucothrix sargassi]|nr:hypothetical protein EOL70_11045 [Leucothrix sargassi]
MNTDLNKRLNLSLLLLRIGVFIVMALWAVDKFVNPAHTAGVFAKFYMIEGLSSGISYVLGALQLALVIAFLVGYKRTISYGLILLMHGVSTFAPFARYFEPWSNMLFFTAWPMLAAILVLFIMREHDEWTVDAKLKG